MTIDSNCTLGCESNARRDFRSTKIQYLRVEKRKMTKEAKATGQKVMTCPPIGKATGIKTWPEDDRPRAKLLKNGTGGFLGSVNLEVAFLRYSC